MRMAGRAAPCGAIAECVLRVCAWRVAMAWCSRDVWPASCTETRGMWHRRIVGSCAGRGGEACDRAVAACGLRHAPMRMACGAVVSWAAVWGAVEVCDRAVDTCGLRHAPQRMACGTVVARVAVRGAVGGVRIVQPRRVACVMHRNAWHVARRIAGSCAGRGGDVLHLRTSFRCCCRNSLVYVEGVSDNLYHIYESTGVCRRASVSERGVRCLVLPAVL